MLHHLSEQPGIKRFEPRASALAPEPVVWAIESARLHNYLLPRDCPRVTFYAGPATTPADVERFLGGSPAVVTVESGWLDRIRAARLYAYQLPEQTFTCIDACAGYHVSREAVAPQGVEVFDDLLTAILARGVELRVTPSLWPLHDAAAASTLEFSIIRMRNAQPRSIVGVAR